MTAIILIVLFTLFAMYSVWTYVLAPSVKKGQKTDSKAVYIIAAAAAAFLLRIIIAALYRGHEQDMGCFDAWSYDVFNGGINAFYASEGFHDYPPGYMYVLYVIGFIRHIIPVSGGALYALIKLPAIVCDILIGYIVYKIAAKKYSSAISTVFAALWLFNPVSILNSAVWGQVDSVYTLFAVLMLYFLTEKKLYVSYFMFAICLFIKPQALILAPVLIGGFIENVILDDFSAKKLLTHIGIGLCAIAAIFLLALPFGIGNVVDQYIKTIGSYPYHTVNAFNFWGAIGKNWIALTTLSEILRNVFIAGISLYIVYIVLKSKRESKYYFAGAIITFLVYMFSTRMHERYAFPAVVLLIITFISMTDIKTCGILSLITASQFFNTAWVLFVYQTDMNKYAFSPVVAVASIINLAITATLFYYVHRHYLESSEKKPKKISALQPLWERETPRIRRADIIAMAVITVVYSCIAFYDLGDMHAAETEYLIPQSGVTIDLGADYDVSEIQYFLGSKELSDSESLLVTGRNSALSQTYSETLTEGDVFKWESKNVNASVRYIDIRSHLASDENWVSIKEIGVRGADGNLITPVSFTVGGAKALFDEQNEVPLLSDFHNSTYFDEIYHARTAYEFIHHLKPYETTHTPLGKIFISLGIRIFGMNPFGWRFAGTFFGVMMVPLIYLFALKFLKKSWSAALTCVLFTFDFMHFAQTRIATIDVYVTFFIMLMFFLMYLYCKTNFYDKKGFKKGLVYLALCGIATGLGIASKVTAVYAALGLFVIMVIMLFVHINEYNKATHKGKKKPDMTNGISNILIRDNFKKHVVITIVWCAVFFVAVPIIILILAYIPFINASTGGHGASFADSMKIIQDNIDYMKWYHGEYMLTLKEHGYSSDWYEWILMSRPLLFNDYVIADGVKEGLSTFGNPFVWWAGVPAFIYLVYRAIRNKDKSAVFLIIAYLSELLPWTFVDRMTFIYHYFPSVPFVVLMVGYSIMCIYENARNKKLTAGMIASYAVIVVGLFVMFYPVISGMPCSTDYVNNYLKWFPRWYFM